MPRADHIHDAHVVDGLTGRHRRHDVQSAVQLVYVFGPDVSGPLVSVADPNDPNPADAFSDEDD